MSSPLPGMVSVLRHNVAGAIYDTLQTAPTGCLQPGQNLTRNRLASLVQILRPTSNIKKRQKPKLAIDVAALIKTGLLTPSFSSTSNSELFRCVETDLRSLVEDNFKTFHYEGITLTSDQDARLIYEELKANPYNFNASSISSSLSSSSSAPSYPLLFDVADDIFVANILNDIQTAHDQYGRFSTLHTANWREDEGVWDDGSKEKLLIEFSSPNIAKPFHVGHLRSTILGNCLSRLNTHLGHSVMRVNYLGDWGTQFGLMAVGLKMFGDNSNVNNESQLPLDVLNNIYVKVNAAAEENESISMP